MTHALVSSLANDPMLLRKFIKWATGEMAPSSQLSIVEQNLPGDEEPQDEEEAERRGLPDGWIFDDDGWCLIVESKIESPLYRDQLAGIGADGDREGWIGFLETAKQILDTYGDIPWVHCLCGS